MKTILLLTNFSATSEKAIESFMLVFAPKLAENYEFILLNTWNQPRTGHFQMINLDDYLEEISGFDLEKQQAKIIRLLPGLKPRIKIQSFKGEIANIVNYLSEKQNPDLVVLGTKGSNVLRELLVGSTTGRIVRQVNAPVLVIPESAQFQRPERIVFATDLKECTNEADFQKLTDIVREFMAEFIILHIYKEEKPDVAKFETCMAKYLDGINYSFHYKQHVQVEQGISEFAVNMNANLLAMILHDDNLLAKLFKHSVASKLTQRAELPLLIIHE